MKKTSKQSLFENVTFESAEAGALFLQKEKERAKFSAIATLVSIPVSILMTVALAAPADSWFKTSEAADPLAVILLILSIACSALCLGFSGIFKYIGRVIKWSWLLIPIFPVDIFMCLLNTIFCIISIFVFPIVPCLFGLYQRRLNLRAAEYYCC